jgi:hypothetical protein
MTEDRYHGWRWGTSKEDRVAFAVFQRFADQKLDFAAYCKLLIYLDETGQTSTVEQVLSEIREVKRLIASGQFSVRAPSDGNEEADQDLTNNLFSLPT